MKARIIYTVIREFSERDAKAARESFAAHHDEAGEYLYGGGGKETLQAELQVKVGARWSTIEVTKAERK